MPAPFRPRAGVGAAVILAGLGALAAAEAPPRPGAEAAAAAVAEAQAALDRGDTEAARAAIARALAVVPDNLAARQLARRIAPPPPDRTAEAAARREATRDDLAAACDDARFLIDAGRARDAIARLDQALTAAGDAGGAMHRLDAERLLVQARAGAAAAAISAMADARNTSAGAARERITDQQRAATSLRAERLERIADLRQRGHLELALAYCRQLQGDLPGDSAVEGLFRDLLAAVHDARRTSLDEREAELRQEVSASIARALIPEGFDGMPMYPSDWGQRHREANSFEAPLQMPEWKAAILDRLAQQVSLQFDGAAIADAIALVSRLGNVNVVAAPELQASDRTVTLHVNAMPLADVLTWMTEQVGTQWSIDRGAIFIGTRTDQARVTSLHDITALLSGSPDFKGPTLNLGAATSAAGAGGGGGGFAIQTTEAKPATTPDDIADLIKRAVSPRTWTTEGNSIAARGNALWITAPEDVQRMIREFLRAQSEQHALAVHLDARWLELSDTAVEEIGVQWQSRPGDMITPPVPGNSGYLRSLAGWSFSGASTNALPASTVNATTGATNTGLSLQAALIGSTQLSAMLTAMEVNAQGRVLQTPELTCLNGQRAYTFFGDEIAYIADYQIVSGNYDPTVKVLNVGSLFEVRPLVSADRRYVTFDLSAVNTQASLFTDYIGSTFLIQGPGGVTVFPGASFPIELPNLRVEQVNTTVMVPDRGSLLVGGFRRAVDQFSATRVPLLGSIPFLGRLFGARGRYAQRSQLYLLTTVTILNYPELEARL